MVIDLSAGTKYDQSTIITSEHDRFVFLLPTERGALMAASKNKVILFGSATHNKVRHLWPVAVFNDAKSAKSYVTFLRLAYRAKDNEVIKVLDPAAKRDDNGVALADTKWSVTEVPYAPAPDLTEEDVPATVSSAT